MKKKKLVALVTAFTLAATGLVACGSSNTQEPAADTAVADSADAQAADTAADSADAQAADNVEVTTVAIATGGTPAPFSYVDEDGNPTGYDVEIIKAALDRLPQYDYTVTVTDFPGIFGGLDTGLYQVGVNNFSYNEQRAEKYIYSTASFKNEYVVAVASDNNDINSFEDLLGKSTELDPDTTYATALQDYNEDHPDNPINISYYSGVGLVEILQHIVDGRADFQIIDKPMFDNYLAEYDLDLKAVTLTEEESNLITTPYSYLLFANDQQELADAVNAELAEMVADGTIKAISEKFFRGEDYTPYDQY